MEGPTVTFLRREKGTDVVLGDDGRGYLWCVVAGNIDVSRGSRGGEAEKTMALRFIPVTIGADEADGGSTRRKGTVLVKV